MHVLSGLVKAVVVQLFFGLRTTVSGTRVRLLPCRPLAVAGGRALNILAHLTIWLARGNLRQQLRAGDDAFLDQLEPLFVNIGPAFGLDGLAKQLEYEGVQRVVLDPGDETVHEVFLAVARAVVRAINQRPNLADDALA